MTGIEKIVDRVKLDSAKKCENIIAQAKQQASEIIGRASTEGEQLIAGANDKAKAQAEDIIRMAQSGAQQKAGQISLAARIEAVNETLAAAGNAVREMPPDAYFLALSALAVKNAMQGTGEMRLSARDIKRMPPQFKSEINEALSKMDSVISISAEPAAIEDGFILVYGDIEINCTFGALIEANRDELKETVCGIIF